MTLINNKLRPLITSLLIMTLFLTLSSCIEHSQGITKQVKVIEIKSVVHRDTYFLGDDGKTYTVNQGNYKTNDTLRCEDYPKTPEYNRCYTK